MDHATSRKHDRGNGSNSDLEGPPKKRQDNDTEISTRFFLKVRHDPPLRRSERVRWILIGSNRVPGVTEVSPGEYQFVIPLTDVPGLNRIALGIRDRATAMQVRIRIGTSNYRRGNEFCIHFPPGDLEDKADHTYCSTAYPWDDHSAVYCCNSDYNFLAHLMAQLLRRQLKDKDGAKDLRGVSAADIRGGLIVVAQEASDHITQRCIISKSCSSPLGFTAARPIACSPKCLDEFQKWPLKTRLSPLLRDPSVIDILFTCLTAQLRALALGPGMDSPWIITPALVDCPFNAETMLRIIDSFPPMMPGITLQDIVSYGHGGKARRQVLDWLCSRFQGMIVPTPPSDKTVFQIPLLPAGVAVVPSRFMLLNTHVQRQATFEEQLKTRHRSKGGMAAFHGTPPQSAFNVLCDGLKLDAHTDGVVYFSDNPRYSAWYIFGRQTAAHNHLFTQGWRNSMFKNQELLFGIEYAEPQVFYGGEATSHQSTVMVRHLFIIPAAAEGVVRNDGFNMIGNGGDIRPQMEETFRRIHDGRLIGELQGSATREEQHSRR